MAGRIVIGTSSWADPGFVADWYPPGLPAQERLPWYAERFEGVEVNSHFYAVPARRHRRALGAGHARRLHLRRQAAPARCRGTPRLERPAHGPARRGRDDAARPRAPDAASSAPWPSATGGHRAAGRRRPAVDLPAAALPRVRAARSTSSTSSTPLVARLAPVPVAVELRHRGWLERRRREDTLGWLEDHGAAFVGVDAPRASRRRSAAASTPSRATTWPTCAPTAATARAGSRAAPSRSASPTATATTSCASSAPRAEGLAERADTVRVMFNNNHGDDAPVAAARLRELLGQVAAASRERRGAPGGAGRRDPRRTRAPLRLRGLRDLHAARPRRRARERVDRHRRRGAGRQGGRGGRPVRRRGRASSWTRCWPRRASPATTSSSPTWSRRGRRRTATPRPPRSPTTGRGWRRSSTSSSRSCWCPWAATRWRASRPRPRSPRPTARVLEADGRPALPALPPRRRALQRRPARDAGRRRPSARAGLA